MNIQDSIKLEQIERNFSRLNAIKLQRKGITGCFDAKHLQSIHKFIFGDIYDWAGEFRQIEIYKGGTEFCEPVKINESINALNQKITHDKFYRGLSLDETANGLSDILAELNSIHPFREGNGRTQRIFLEQLALNAGWDLSFEKWSENDTRDASRTAARGDMRLMHYMMKSSLIKLSDDKAKKCSRMLSDLPYMPKRDLNDDFEL